MAGLCIIITEKLKSSIRGSLTRWLMEVKTGVFVGTVTARVREALWERVIEGCRMMKNLAMEDAGAILIHQSNTEQGFEMRMHGNYSKAIVDFDGLQLVKTMHKKSTRKGKKRAKMPRMAAKPGSPSITRDPNGATRAVVAVRTSAVSMAGQPDAIPVTLSRAGLQGNQAAPRGSQGEYPWLKEGDVANRWMPAGFAERWVILSPAGKPRSCGDVETGDKEKTIVSSGGGSTYHEIAPSETWKPAYLAEVVDALETCLKAARIFQESRRNAVTISDQPGAPDIRANGANESTGDIESNMGGDGRSGMKIACLDIETTTFLPKAFEGYVNVVGVAVLDYRGRPGQENQPVVALYQAFNMYRKRAMVPALLQLARPFFEDADVLLVFNRDFDIDILETVIKADGLDLRFPEKIVDLRELHPSLKALEAWLWLMVGFKRRLAPKGNIGEYYAAFKGQGRDGCGKCLEPIGTYNALDAITPLVAYLLHELNEARKPGARMKNQNKEMKLA